MLALLRVVLLRVELILDDTEDGQELGLLVDFQVVVDATVH